MKRILLAAVGLVALGMAAPASAADLAARPYTKAPPPMVAPIYDWTGFYIGGKAAIAWISSLLSEPLQAVAIVAPEALSADKSAIAGK
jgi:outer membrane immunogenic protein